MLKRQRPSSPFLPSSVPFVSDSPDDIIDRTSKRRRTIPPVLDGSSRGWASPPQELEDGDDYYDDEYSSSYNSQSSHVSEVNPEYKSANAILRELHVLHQHRALFSPSDTTSHATQSDHHLISTSSTHVSRPEGLPTTKGYLQSPLQTHPQPTFTHRTMTPGKAGQLGGPLSEEVDRVTERYESANKLLGSLFLSRRRELDSADEIPGR